MAISYPRGIVTLYRKERLLFRTKPSMRMAPDSVAWSERFFQMLPITSESESDPTIHLLRTSDQHVV